MEEIAIFWFRRDLRLFDNAGLDAALKSGLPVLPLFIFDTEILDELPENDARVTFIHQEITAINLQLRAKGSGLKVEYGKPTELWRKLLMQFNIKAVFTNRDYEPYAQQRDAQIESLLTANGTSFNTFKDHLLIEPGQVLKDNGEPYVVFTPFSKRWLTQLTEQHLQSFADGLSYDNWLKVDWQQPISLEAMGFVKSQQSFPPKVVDADILKHYKQRRDFPAMEATSNLSLHLRFGTISIRQLARQAQQVSAVILNELIWREFYAHILWHFPRVVQQAFYTKYDRVPWRNNEAEFNKWCAGKTGYPMVDAGMRQLNETGLMHNRVRMVVASFLTKHLLIDWRWGEAYFAEKLLDFELASNNGGWQWAAGCGTDAAPYFRVFSPDAQQKRFDAKGQYILKWLPEYGTPAYPQPIVDHKMARQRAIDTYKRAVSIG